MRNSWLASTLFATGVVVFLLGAVQCASNDPAGVDAGPILGTGAGPHDSTAPLQDAPTVGTDALIGPDSADSPTGTDASADASTVTDAPNDVAQPDARGVDAAEAAAAWDPSQIGSGLVLWLKASVATFSGNTLTTWPDQSGNMNNATLGGGCTTPLLQAGSLNGLDTMQFTGSGSCVTVTDAASLQWSTGDFAVFLVGRYSNIPTGAFPPRPTFWQKASNADGARFVGYYVSTTALAIWQNNMAPNIVWTPTTGFNDNKFRRLGMHREGSAFSLLVNGAVAAQGTINPLDVSVVGSDVVIGQNVIGNIAELVAVKGPLSAASIAALDAYWKAKYALP